MSSMIGEKAPDFNLKTSDGVDFNFSELEDPGKYSFFMQKQVLLLARGGA